MVKGSIGQGLTVKAGKENSTKGVTADSYVTVENPGDETMGAAQTCDIIVSTTQTSAAAIMKYLSEGEGDRGRGLRRGGRLLILFDERGGWRRRRHQSTAAGLDGRASERGGPTSPVI